MSRLLGRGALALFAVLQAVPGAPAQRPLPEVAVTQLALREFTDHADFTGRLEASEMVEVRPAMSGTITKVHFRDGARVKKGDVLFELDSRAQKLKVEKAEAEVAVAAARHKMTTTQLARARRLLAEKALDRNDFERALANHADAEAGKKIAEANLALARLDLERTRIAAPIAGKIGRSLLPAGAFVRAGAERPLAAIAGEGPLRASFDLDERTFLRLARWRREKKVAKGERVPVFMGLRDEKGYPHVGQIDFIEGPFDPNTDTLPVRAAFVTALDLLPGLFVRVRVSLGKPRQALLVPVAAVTQGVGLDGSETYVVVLDEKNVVRKVSVTLSELTDGRYEVTDGRYEVTAGVKAGQWVVVGCLPREVNLGDTVRPRKADVPAHLPAKKPAGRPKSEG